MPKEFTKEKVRYCIYAPNFREKSVSLLVYLFYIIIDDLRKYGPILDDIEASFLALSNGMFFWRNTHKFCGSCGFQNLSTEGGFVMKCTNQKCGKSHFPRTDPAIITLISFQDKVLLGRSSRFPDSMYLSLIHI